MGGAVGDVLDAGIEGTRGPDFVIAALDAITAKKLVLAKRVYQFGLGEATTRLSTTGAIMAVVAFDLAVETLLKTVVNCLDTSRTPAETFDGLIQQAEHLLVAAGVGNLPDEANVRHVHRIRNDAQHKARYPTESEVSDSRTYVRDFMKKVLAQVWAISLDQVRLTDLVKHQRVKAFLEEGQAALAQRRYVEAAEQSVAGLHWALELVRRAIVGPSSWPSRAFVMSDGFGHSKEDRGTYRAFERMQESLLYVALGMDYSGYMKCNRTVGSVSFTLDGTPHFSRGGAAEELDPAEAEFVVAYATDAVIEVETRVGDLEAPFGSDRWY